MTELDEAALSYQIVLTKADKVTAGGLAVARSGRSPPSSPAIPPPIPRSSPRQRHKGEGIAELRAALAAVAEFAPPALSTPTPFR